MMAHGPDRGPGVRHPCGDPRSRRHCERIRTGQLITIDGANGTVMIDDPDPDLDPEATRRPAVTL